MLGKFCVFCGEKPKGKNKEHVIPYWLLELTGRPTRSVALGLDWRNPKSGLVRRFSYSSFTFPACGTCNGEFSDLEGRAKQVILAMLAGQPVGAANLDTLLDWLDKIRVGLWLGLLYLNGNMHNIRPQFYIKQRMAAYDRLVVIYRDDDPAQGVMWAGADSPIFHIMPSCMSLVINTLHLFNASSGFLLASRMGFPSQAGPVMTPDGAGEYYTRLNEGTQQTELPLVPYPIWPGGTQLYQPMIPHFVGSTGGDMLHYDNDYVKERCLDHEAGKGRVFQLKDGALTEYPTAPSLDWLPPLTMVKRPLLDGLPLQAMDWLERMLTDCTPSLDQLKPDRREFVLREREKCVRMHRLMVEVQNEVIRRSLT
jgi:hypothetical protein